MGTGRLDYLAYMLRLWRAENNVPAEGEEPGSWRASLEDAQTGQRMGFGSLAELFAFLESHLQPAESRQAPRKPSFDASETRDDDRNQ